MAQNEKLAELSEAGVAVWLDDLSWDRIRSGGLQSLVDDYSVVGVTTNPTIFAAAISGSDAYDDQVHAMAIRKISVGEALRTITAADVRDLIAPDTVNTMPEKTLKAYADHGRPGTPIQRTYDEAAQVMKAVADAGVDLDDVFEVLEDQGIQKFADSWDQLTESARTELEDKK